MILIISNNNEAMINKYLHYLQVKLRRVETNEFLIAWTTKIHLIQRLNQGKTKIEWMKYI